MRLVVAKYQQNLGKQIGDVFKMAATVLIMLLFFCQQVVSLLKSLIKQLAIAYCLEPICFCSKLADNNAIIFYKICLRLTETKAKAKTNVKDHG